MLFYNSLYCIFIIFEKIKLMFNTRRIIIALSVFIVILIILIKIKTPNNIDKIDLLPVQNTEKHITTKPTNSLYDSFRIKSLISKFKIEKDEFSSNKKIWYTPKTAPKFINRNGIYIYFQTYEGKASNLRFRIQYAASDWLFYDKADFSIDGETFSFVPAEVKRDNDQDIWEWSDDEILGYQMPLINALSNGSSVKMKLIGTNYEKVKQISTEEINSIKNTLLLYRAMGGDL